MHQCLKFILFWNGTLHVSNGLSVHHQEFKTVHTTTGVCQTDTANSEFDLKRVIALSTLRQLGLTIVTISIGLTSLAFFHLLTHALFKALLFMYAGGVIPSIGDPQDTASKQSAVL